MKDPQKEGDTHKMYKYTKIINFYNDMHINADFMNGLLRQFEIIHLVMDYG